MEEIHLPSPASCANELTRSNSDSDSDASSLTTEDILDHKANTSPCECAAWTNEKHDQYLNRLESSFVKQLHQSLGQLAWCSELGKNARSSSMKQLANSLSKQFTFIRDGCWQKINYGKTTTADSLDAFKSPRVKHLRHAGRPSSTRPQELCQIHQEENLLREQKMSHRAQRCRQDLPVNDTCHCDFVGSCAEGSGQNFTDEACEDDLTFQRKKLKTAIADISKGDQTVPSWELLPRSNSVVGDIALQEHVPHQSTAEDFRSFGYPQTELESFLKGS